MAAPLVDIGELHQLTTFDGKSIVFDSHSEDVMFRVYGQYGAPPTSYQTRRGYRQDGETEIAFFLDSRHISVMLYQSAANDRKTYWANRAALHDFLRPNRNGPITLTLRTPGSLHRSLVVRADPGLLFPPMPDDENGFDIQEQLDFIAYDPVWFDPAQVVSTPASAFDTSLIFPITFPITFGLNGTLFQAAITYAGSWKSYPTITLTGPFTAAVITNLATGFYFSINATVLAGQTRVITLTPGSISIVDQAGANHFSDLGPGSDLVDFNLQPDPIVSKGIQTIRGQFTGAVAGQTAFSISYYNRYFAI